LSRTPKDINIRKILFQKYYYKGFRSFVKKINIFGKIVVLNYSTLQKLEQLIRLLKITTIISLIADSDFLLFELQTS